MRQCFPHLPGGGYPVLVLREMPRGAVPVPRAVHVGDLAIDTISDRVSALFECLELVDERQ